MPMHASAAEIPDSIGISYINPTEQFKWSKLILPGSLIALGAWGVSNGWLASIKEDVQDDMAHLSDNCHFHGDNYIQYAPAAAYLGVGFIPGVEHTHTFKERLCAGITAYAVMAIVTNVTKHIVREPRPDTGARNSFPSGHTATAFTGAELMRLEYGWRGGIAGYALGLGVGFLRLYNNRHWINDVVAGAGIGILSANIGYWLIPFERKIFGIDRKRNMAVLPYAMDSRYGLSLVAIF